jgi:uncharacterized protein (DUF983 family)
MEVTIHHTCYRCDAGRIYTAHAEIDPGEKPTRDSPGFPPSVSWSAVPHHCLSCAEEFSAEEMADVEGSLVMALDDRQSETKYDHI